MGHSHNSSGVQKLTRLLPTVLFVVMLALITVSASAQQEDPGGPYYVVQAGDSLWDISQRFGIDPEALAQANGITNPDQIAVGMKLAIPGLTGFSGEIKAQAVPFGSTLFTLARWYGYPVDTLVQLNQMTSPSAAYAGASLLAPTRTEEKTQPVPFALSDGQSVYSLAIANRINPWALQVRNGVTSGWDLVPGDVLFIPVPGTSAGEAFDQPGVRVSIDPIKLRQGKTAVVYVAGPPGMTITGSLGEGELRFFPTAGGYAALQGIHALAEPGLVFLDVQGQYPADSPAFGQVNHFSQTLLIASGSYPFDPVLMVDPETIDPAVTKPEDALWKSLASAVTPDKLWDGPFVSPVPAVFKDCWTSLFGNRRSYNNGPYDFFHGGLDFCGREGTELYATAVGRVVFVDSLKVRGKVTVIDHGWGVYTAYAHQSDQLVKVGDVVQPGQPIGLGGATGRTTGPHLHWEVWVGGVQVDPVDWLERTFPSGW